MTGASAKELYLLRSARGVRLPVRFINPGGRITRGERFLGGFCDDIERFGRLGSRSQRMLLFSIVARRTSARGHGFSLRRGFRVIRAGAALARY